MIRLLIVAIIAAVFGGCTAHTILTALDKEAQNQLDYIEEYNAQIDEMEVGDYE